MFSSAIEFIRPKLTAKKVLVEPYSIEFNCINWKNLLQSQFSTYNNAFPKKNEVSASVQWVILLQRRRALNIFNYILFCFTLDSIT